MMKIEGWRINSRMDGLKIKRAFQHEVNGGQLKEVCQSTHLARIQGMKRISEPPLLIEVYTICQNLPLEEYRRKWRPKGRENSRK